MCHLSFFSLPFLNFLVVDYFMLSFARLDKPSYMRAGDVCMYMSV